MQLSIKSKNAVKVAVCDSRQVDPQLLLGVVLGDFQTIETSVPLGIGIFLEELGRFDQEL